jgi:hypothetical protein
MPSVPNALKELTGLLELLRPCALGEIAADDDEIGLQLVDASLDSSNQPVVVGTEMQVRKVDEASHARSTAVMLNWFQHPSRRSAVPSQKSALSSGRPIRSS